MHYPEIERDAEKVRNSITRVITNFQMGNIDWSETTERLLDISSDVSDLALKVAETAWDSFPKCPSQ